VIVENCEIDVSDLSLCYIIIVPAPSRKKLAHQGQVCYFFNSFPGQEAPFMRRMTLLAIGLLLLTAQAARADFYRWVDRDGHEFFTNDRKQIPPEYQGQATVVKPDERRVSISEKQPPQGKVARAPEHKDKNGHGEEYWRKRADDLRGKMRKQQDEYDLVLKQIDEQDQKAKASIGKKKKSTTSLEKKKQKLEKDIDRTRRSLEVDLPEEARRADAYPGWVRE
jgi:hypothetical protein